VRGMPTPPKLPQEVWINRPPSSRIAVPTPDPTQPGAQAVSRVTGGQAQRSLDTAEHLATMGRALEQPGWIEMFDTNFSPELSRNA
jgi:hypothetical protein